MKLAIFILTLFLTCSMQASSILEQAILEGHLDNEHYSIEFIFSPMPAFPNYPDAPKYWTILRELKVKIGDNNIKIPKSAIKDLFCPHTPGEPYFDPSGNIRLPLKGGDGGASYRVDFIFKKGRFVARDYYPYMITKPITIKYAEQGAAANASRR